MLREGRVGRILIALMALVLLAASCGSGDDTDTTESSTVAETAETPVESEPEPTAETITVPVDDDETMAEEDEEPEAEEADEAMAEEDEEPEAEEDEEAAEEEMAEVPPPSGTLRIVEFSPVTTFNPAGAQPAQSAYLYGEYDTLTRQNAAYELEPALATSWDRPDPNTWVFTIREGVTFHDGSPLNGEVVAANMLYHKNFEGNPNTVAWSGVTDVEATGEYEVTVSFGTPQPQFGLQMSMVMGMMISGEAIAEDRDMTRAPAGSGPWQWSEEESVAGVTEVYNAVPDYWNPADQGVERIEVTAVPDNSARLNALLTGETDIMGTIRDPQVADAEAFGGQLAGVANYLPYILITGRDGGVDEPLGDVRVRQAMAHAIDRDAYNNAIHAGRADGNGGIYPTSFSQFYSPELDDFPEFDQERARELLAEAGYPDGITITAPIMPVIQPHVELVNQMWAAVGITVEQDQINNGELGPRIRAGDWGVSWFRDLLYHPANDLPKFVATEGPFNPFGLEDMKDLQDMLVEAANSTDLAEQKAIYAEVSRELIDRGVVIPLAHARTQSWIAEGVTGAVQGMNMQAPMPFGVRLDS